MKKNTYWILVNYNNCDDIHKLISLYQKDLNFIIVDNSNNYKSFNDEVVIIPDKNLGYLGGFIFALNNFNNFNKKIIFSNSDIEIIKGFKDIVKYNKKVESVFVPKIISPSGDQNPHILNRKNKKHWILRKVLSSNFIFWYIWSLLVSLKKKTKKIVNNNSNLIPEKIYAGHGSFYIFNNINFSKFKSLNHNFLYAEEIHFAEFFNRSNIPVLYNSKIIIHHNEHASTSKINNNFRRTLFYDSYKSILSKYY